MSNSSNTAMQAGEKKKPSFSLAISSKGYQKLINNSIRDKNDANQFVAALVSVVSVNPALQECETSSIVAAALLGQGLRLSPSPQLGHYYLVPFNDNKTGTKKAQFILGYKGYLQLAQRSGVIKKLVVVAVKESEFISWNPFEEDFEYKLNDNEDERLAEPTVGYYAFYELQNGFRKVMYWTKEKMVNHADRFSPAFSKDAVTFRTKNGGTKTKVSYDDYEAGNYAEADEWMYSSFWYKQFDDMACKTMLRQLISKGGCPMSIEMQKAFENDNSFAEIEDDNVVTVPQDEIIVENTNNINEQINNPEVTDVQQAIDLDSV